MSLLKSILSSFLLISVPSLGRVIKSDPELTGGYLEGDMILSPVQNFIIEHPFFRNAVHSTDYLWPHGIVHFKISPKFDSAQSAYIQKAMADIQAKTCIQFRLANSTSLAYLDIIGDHRGCYSYVGFQGVTQSLNLHLNSVGLGCFRLGSIIHELLHALGFHHQQSASERDEYIIIKTENIQTGAENNFRKYPNTVVTNLGIIYDYDSVMHYSAKAFTKNGLSTIVPRNTTARIGQRFGMSNRDVEKINLMYRCVGK